MPSVSTNTRTRTSARAAIALAACFGLLVTACQAGAVRDAGQVDGLAPGGGDVTVQLELTSDAFATGDAIPVEHTCDGADLSPPLSWPAGPDGTVEYVLVVDDPDAPGGTWVHWVAWGIAGTELPQGITPDDADLEQGQNSWGEAGYRGPCPPPGPEHNYSFRVYALDAALDLPSDAEAQQLMTVMSGHVLGAGELLGRYGRSGE